MSASSSSPAVVANTENKAPQQQLQHLLTVFDVENKYIAFAAPVKRVRALLSEWGALFALTGGKEGSMETPK